LIDRKLDQKKELADGSGGWKMFPVLCSVLKARKMKAV
ncbi:hypothetical protein C819_02491, partial [Lachnospiraceae bacterium 10-1]